MRGSTHRASTKLIVSSLAVAVLGCGSDSGTAVEITETATAPSPPPTSPETLEGVTGELIISRQRDLIDRGLINVLVHNDSGRAMLMDAPRLDADFFTAEAVAQRTISLRHGRRVAVQVPYGVADDCDADRPVSAVLAFRATTNDEVPPQDVSVDLDGTDLLDAIRARQCATRDFEAAARAQFDGASIVDGTVVADLVIEPTGTATSTATVGAADIVVEGVSGTILIGVRSSADWTDLRLGAEPVIIPVVFVVNRCDPHALAEVTKRYGLDLAVSIDGAAPVAVAVDVTELVADLETIVEQCTAAAAAGD